MTLIGQWIISAVAIAVAAWLVPGIAVRGEAWITARPRVIVSEYRISPESFRSHRCG